MQGNGFWRWGLVIGALIALLVAAVTFYNRRPPAGTEAPPSPTAERPPGFRERALQSGLTFHMRFLPNEQGLKFKINLYDHGCGLAIGDYDGDGHDDLYFVNQLGPNALYRNRGDGTFVETTAAAGVVLGDRICTGATFADYDNDGDQDLFVTSTRGGNVLFRNQGNGTFVDVTAAAGLTHVGHSQTAVFFDFDNDGLLDLFVANTAEWTTAFDASQRYFPGKTLGGGPDGDLIKSRKESNLLYRNNGNGTFTNVTEASGLKGRGWSSDVAVLDYNDDGRLDLLVSNMFGPSQLYRNDGGGKFTDVTGETLRVTSYGACGAKAFDFNNDGRLDLFLADMHSDMWMGLDAEQRSLLAAMDGQKMKYRYLAGPPADRDPPLREQDLVTADLLGYRREDVVYGNTFFANRGGGKFEEKSDPANLETFWPWGIATGDFDNDGFEDVFLPSGMGYPFYYWPNQLLMNTGKEAFVERGTALGIEPPERGLNLPEKIGGKDACRSSRCAAVADFDGDGRLEIVTNNFNDQPYYFKNELPRKNFLAFRLRGTKSNRDAIGALVKVYVDGMVLTRQVNPAGGYLSQSSKTVHFGLGDRTRVERVEIRWPRGLKQELVEPQINTRHGVVEP